MKPGTIIKLKRPNKPIIFGEVSTVNQDNKVENIIDLKGDRIKVDVSDIIIALTWIEKLIYKIKLILRIWAT